MLTKGMAVVQHFEGKQDLTLRILDFHPSGRAVAIIPAVTKKKVGPTWADRDQLERAFRRNEIERCETDPHAQLFDPKYDNPAFQGQFAKYARCRDSRWKVIKPLVATFDIYDRQKRGPLVAARAKEMGVSKNSIYKWLRMFWQSGLRKDALIPRWEWNRRGGRSPRKYRGVRLKSFTDRQSRVWYGVQAVMAWGLETYRSFGWSLKRIADRINAKYFSNGTVWKDGVAVPVVKKENITRWQLRHFRRKYWNKAAELKSQIGEDEYNSNYRAKTGTASKRAHAPGACFQMDCSKTPLKVVSPLNRAYVLGKVTFCVVTDQFSELICGFSIDYRDESYVSYMLAIEHAATDKVQWCRQYGRTITREDWPCEHLAKTYVTDRGPLRKWAGNHLVNALGIDLENAPAYRPDLRGLVESVIGMIKLRALKYCDGAVDRPRSRGKRRRRKEETLTIDVLTKIVMEEIICYNKRVLEGRRPTKEMLRDGVPRVPTKLWAWGIRRLGGCLRKEDVNTLRLNLLPCAHGSITDKGLLFNGRLYSCDPALVEQARREGWIPTLVHHDPRLVDVVYRRVNLTTVDIEVCPLSKGDDAWQGMSEEDYVSVTKRFKKMESAAAHEFQQARAEADARIDALQQEARRQHAKDLRDLGLTKNDARNTKARRQEAQALRDKEHAWRFPVNSTHSDSPTPSGTDTQDDQYWDALEMNAPSRSTTPPTRRPHNV